MEKEKMDWKDVNVYLGGKIVTGIKSMSYSLNRLGSATLEANRAFQAFDATAQLRIKLPHFIKVYLAKKPR